MSLRSSNQPTTSFCLSAILAGLVLLAPSGAHGQGEPAPTFAKVFTPDAILFGATSGLTFTIDNSASALAADSLAFIDNLPNGVVVATPPIPINTCGGTLTANAGAAVISLSGGSVGAGASCTISVDVKGTAGGRHTNTTGDLTSTSGNSGTATDDLNVEALPELSATKTDALLADNDGDTVPSPGDVLGYTITISNAVGGATGVVLNDLIPANTTIVPGSVTTTQGTGVSEDPVQADIGTLAGGTAVTIMFAVLIDNPVPAGVMDVVNQGTVTANNSPAILTDDPDTGAASDPTETMIALPRFTKVFAPDTIGNTFDTTLTFTIDNTASILSATGLAFLDLLPFNLWVATVPSVANTCGGDVVAAAGTSTISLAGGTAGATSTCTLSVRVNGPTPGLFDNVTSNLSSSAGLSPPALDTLTVVDCPAANGANFTLRNILVVRARTYVACNTIKVDKDVQVLGFGVLTLKAGVSVVVKELEISGGEMTVEIDPSLIP